MRITLPPLNVEKLDGFKDDALERAQFGKGLSHLLATVDEPLVLAVDGQWGAGKSTFLKMWAGDLRRAGYSVVEFDAFSHDYLQDAFLAIASELIDLSRQATDEDFKKTLLERSMSVGKVVLRGAARLTTRVATLSLVKGDELEKLADELSDDLADVADESLKEILTGQSKARDTFDAFRSILAGLPDALSKKEIPPRPLVVIIDELDRCRPAFALELLESIKHFFSVPKVHFVLGTHLDQLENSVRARYGSQIDARTYLQKFIHISAVLPTDDRAPGRGTADKYAEHVFRNLNVPAHQRDRMEFAATLIGHIARHNSLSLRDIERIMSAVLIADTYAGAERPTPYIVGLAILRLLHPDLYKKARDGNLVYNDISKIFALGQSADFNYQHVQEMWQHATRVQLEGQTALDMSRYGDAHTILPSLCRSVIERFRTPR